MRQVFRTAPVCDYAKTTLSPIISYYLVGANCGLPLLNVTFADTKNKRLQSLSRLTAPAPFAQRSLLIRFICASVRYIFRFVGRGLAPAAVLFGQSGTPVPTFRKRAFVSSHTKKRCGVWDTVASVPTTFLLLFSSPEKRRYSTQSGTPVTTVKERVFIFSLTKKC